MQFTLKNDKGDTLTIEAPHGTFTLALGITLVASEAAPSPVLTLEQQHAQVEEEATMEEKQHRRALLQKFERVPKRGINSGTGLVWEYWNGSEWVRFDPAAPPLYEIDLLDIERVVASAPPAQ